MSGRLQGLFGQKLKQTRRSNSKKLVQEDLAKALGVSRTTVSNIERGRHRVFLDQVYVAARELGVAVEVLLPPLTEVFPATEISTAHDVSFDSNTAKAAAEVARSVSERIASRAPKVIGSRKRR